jgi:choline dehydrogenase-like flavoprotein
VTTVERRLAEVEASMTPTQLVLRWLDEAHRYNDLNAYARSLVETGPAAFPMDRLAREASESARTRGRGVARDELTAIVNRAIVETIFRAQLVLRINEGSHAFLDREGLIQAALSAYLGLVVDRPTDRAETKHVLGLCQIRDLLLGRVTELHAHETARAKVEARYLDGVAADFPAAQREWADQRTRSETMAVIAVRLAELDGADPPQPDDPEAFEARVVAMTSDLIEPARSKAYDELGDGRRALELAVRWLRPKLLEGPPVGTRS